MTATLLILLSAIVHAVVNVLTKRAEDKLAMRLLIGVFSAVIVAPFLLLVAPPDRRVVAFLFATAAVHCLYEIFLVRAYENADFSAVYPVARGTGPLFAALGAVFLIGERPPLVEVLGILAISGGVIAMGLARGPGSAALTGFAYALLTGATIGLYTVIDAEGSRAGADAFTYPLWFFVAHGVSVSLTAPALRGRTVIAGAVRQWRLGVLVAALSIVTYGSALLAFRYGATAELAALRETSVLFGVVLAVAFLGERMTPARWLAAGAIALGAFLVKAA